MTGGPDRWHRWLLDTRSGGDAATRERLLSQLLYPVRDTVLSKAHLAAGETVLDVGTGDGLIAFGALERLGPAGQVIFSDISQALLDHCRAAATAENVLDRCRFVLAPADDLSAVADGSVDVVTTRSVLIYVKDKARALHEFYRVLKPGGRVSLFEPINVLMFPAEPDQFVGYDVTSVRAQAARVTGLYESLQPPGADPMVDFDDRDLVRQAEKAGFPKVDLELRVSVEARKEPVPWEVFMRTAGNPLVPTMAEAMSQVLSPQEITEFTTHLRPLVESGTGVDRSAVAYLTAVKN